MVLDVEPHRFLEQLEILVRKDGAGTGRLAHLGSPNAAAGVHRRRADYNVQAANWFIVLAEPPALSAASPAKYSLWSSPMSEPDMFWCFTQAIP